MPRLQQWLHHEQLRVTRDENYGRLVANLSEFMHRASVALSAGFPTSPLLIERLTLRYQAGDEWLNAQVDLRLVSMFFDGSGYVCNGTLHQLNPIGLWGGHPETPVRITWQGPSPDELIIELFSFANRAAHRDLTTRVLRMET